jgi:REP element-mobilizing transposase RayT
MKLNEIGKIAQKYWLEIPQHFQFIELGAFVIMPNHVHGILIMDKTNVGDGVGVETPNLGVSTDSPTLKTAAASEKWKSGTLGVIINQYKRICTIHARKIHTDFAWQPRFYDHIIRNKESFERIQEYIINNPLNWITDKFYL